MNYIKNVGDNQNKFGDTATVFQIGLMKDNEVYNFGDDQVTVNIANETGYVLSVTPDKFLQNTVLNLDFNKVPLKNLTPDNYYLEVEVKSADGDIAKFPTSGAMTFSINHDLKETSGTLVPTVTFDNVLDAVDEKIAVYMDTVKVGPQGPVGPAGNVDTSNDNTFTGANKFTQPIEAILKERGTLTGTVDVLQMVKQANLNSGVWKLNGVTISGSGQDLPNNIWGSMQIIPIGDGTGAEVLIIASAGFGSVTAQIIGSGGASDTSINWRRLSDDAVVVHNYGTETVAGDKTFTGNSSFTGPTTLQTGNHGLRVTTTGVQKTSDGGTTWVNI